MISPAALAAHEAGHVVVANALDVRVTRVRVTLWPLQLRDGAVWWSSTDPVRNAIVLFAGTHAQHRVEPNGSTSSLDFKMVDLALDQLGLVDVLARNRQWHRCCDDAERLVTDRWRAIERVAQVLLDVGELSGDEVRRLCRR
jgi:hypothetical protein